MPFEDPRSLAAVGLRPKGTGPSSLETIIGGASKFVDSYFEQQEKESKKAKDNLDMYITLRKAGYTSDQAADGVRKRGITGGPKVDVYGAEAEEAQLKPEKTRADIEKTKAGTEKEKAYADYYRKGGAKTGAKAQEQERQDIKDALDAGEITWDDLTPGQKKLFYGYTEPKSGKTTADITGAINEKIGEGDKKMGGWDLGAFIGNVGKKIFGGPAKAGVKEEAISDTMVAVYDPNGKPGKIKASQLQKALKVGYRKR